MRVTNLRISKWKYNAKPHHSTFNTAELFCCLLHIYEFSKNWLISWLPFLSLNSYFGRSWGRVSNHCFALFFWHNVKWYYRINFCEPVLLKKLNDHMQPLYFYFVCFHAAIICRLSTVFYWPTYLDIFMYKYKIANKFLKQILWHERLWYTESMPSLL